MLVNSVIGIDPDAKGFICCLVKNRESKVFKKAYSVNKSGLDTFIKWVKDEKDVIVAIEGTNGQSYPIEKTLKDKNIDFYSLKPAEVDHFRKAVMGQNKNNKNDAEATARYALALENQGKLDKHKRLWEPDIELRMLTRGHTEKTKEITREKSRLWKYLKLASADLYLTLSGNNPDSEVSVNLLTNKGILTLLAQKSDIYSWKSSSKDDIRKAMGDRNYQGYSKLIDEIIKISRNFTPVPTGVILTIKHSASTILLFQQQKKDIIKSLKQLTSDNKEITSLCKHKGIATLTAAKIIAEIIDIRRFYNNNKLASYAGLGRKEHSTGENKNMVPSYLFNHRLKNAFMTAAKNFVIFNPDSHLSGYYRNLIKHRGMSFTEAIKRVARALVRIFFRELSVLIEVEKETGESNMASGSDRSDKFHISNIKLSPDYNHNTENIEIINMMNKEKKNLLNISSWKEIL